MSTTCGHNELMRRWVNWRREYLVKLPFVSFFSVPKTSLLHLWKYTVTYLTFTSLLNAHIVHIDPDSHSHFPLPLFSTTKMEMPDMEECAIENTSNNPNDRSWRSDLANAILYMPTWGPAPFQSLFNELMISWRNPPSTIKIIFNLPALNASFDWLRCTMSTIIHDDIWLDLKNLVGQLPIREGQEIERELLYQVIREAATFFELAWSRNGALRTGIWYAIALAVVIEQVNAQDQIGDVLQDAMENLLIDTSERDRYEELVGRMEDCGVGDYANWGTL